MQAEFITSDGRRIHFRPVTPDDEPLIAAAITTASPETLLHRFFLPLRGLPRDELRRLLSLDPQREFCIVGETTDSQRIVCGARYVRLADPGRAEIALTVHDDFQRKGLGRFLLNCLAEHARQHGVRTLVAEVLGTNVAMLRLLQSFAPERRSSFHSGVCHVEFDLR